MRANPTIAQIKHHSELVAKKHKALSCLHTTVTEEIFNRIMTCESAKQAWDRLAEEYQGDQKARQMEVLNLRRELEMLRMKEGETVKDYSDRVMKVVNQLRLLGEDLKDTRVVEKILVSFPEKFEAIISSLDNSKDLTKNTLPELINSLHVVELRQSLRQEQAVAEGAMVSQVKGKFKAQGKKNFEDQRRQNIAAQAGNNNNNKTKGKKETFPPCPHCGRRNHTENYCWVRPRVQCKICKRFGHYFKICKAKNEQP